MMEVAVSINRTKPLVVLRVVRISPVDRNPEQGEECTYNLYIDGTFSGIKLKHPYSCGMQLAELMLKTYNQLEKSV